eukprot:2400825-Alexandrium_andersonii.AAC.1
MSASLVGSEMCIRDRVLGVCPLRAVAGRVGAQPPRWQLCRRQCHLPVSYTHLTLPTICSV